MDPYTTHADTIESALTHTCRAHRLSPDAADEFASWARLRLLGNDQAILRKFEGRSKLRTFLITVVQRLYLDWRNAEWGKWRPTAEARRLGPVAIELERMVIRDHLTYDEAVHTLTARQASTPEACEALWVQLPRRPRRKRVEEQAMLTLAGTSTASETVDDDESRAEMTAVCEALTRAMGALSAADQTLLQLRYWGKQSVARIAAMTDQDQKALYRRYERLADELRRTLEAEGLNGRMLAAFDGRFEPPPSAGSGLNPAIAEFPNRGPSTEVRTGGEHG